MAIVNNLIMQVDGNNYVVYPYTVGRAVYINESNGYNLIQALEDLRNNAVAEWINIRNKPFTTLSNSFKVVGGQLQLNGSFSTEWNDIQNKPSVFNTSWSRVSGKPESYPSSWDDLANKPNSFVSDWNSVQNKPNYFPAEWNNIANKPTDFNAEWNDVRNKPDYYPTNWELVENRPEQLASTWDDIANKPFNTLDGNYLFSDSNNRLSLINTFMFIDNDNRYQYDINENNYYIFYNLNLNNSYAEAVQDGFILPQFPTLKSLVYLNYNDALNFDGIQVPVQGLIKYNDINKALTIPIDGSDYYSDIHYYNALRYYLNSNISNTFKNLMIDKNDYNFFNLNYVINAQYAFENVIFINKASSSSSNKFYSFACPNLLFPDYMFYNAGFTFNSMDSGTHASFTLYYNNQINYRNKYMFDNMYMITPNPWTDFTFGFRALNQESTESLYSSYFGLNNVNATRICFEIDSATQNRLSSGYDGFQIYMDNCNINQISGGYYNNIYLNCPNSQIRQLNLEGSFRIEGNIINLQALNVANVKSDIRGLNLDGNDNNQSWLTLTFNNVTHRTIGQVNVENFIGFSFNAYNSQVTFENTFRNCIINNESMNYFFNYLHPTYNCNIALYNTFMNTRLNNGGVFSYAPFLYRPFSILYHAFDSCYFIQSGGINDSVLTASYVFNNCPNLVNAYIPNSPNLNEAEYMFAHCPNITNIQGGGYVGQYSNNYLNNLYSIAYAFYNSDLKDNVEFNLYAIQNCNAENLFGGIYSNAYTKEKKIHIFKDSALDKASLTNPYFIENNASLNAENITVLDNGRYFGDYHLYIYNDIQSPVYFFNNIYGTIYNDTPNWEIVRNIIITNVYFTNQVINPLDSNLWALGPWDKQENTSLTMAYLNNLTNELYLTQNNEVNNCSPTFFNGLSNAQIVGLNIAGMEYIYSIPAFKQNKEVLNFVYFASNTKVIKPLNLNRLFVAWNLNYDNVNLINASYMYNNTPVTTAVAALKGKMNNMAFMFNNCQNLTTQFNGEFNLAEGPGGVNFSYMFYNCVNLIEPLIPNKFNTSNTGHYTDIFNNMYTNCFNLINGYIGPTFGAYSLGGMFDNCYNLQAVIMDIEDEDSIIYKNGSFSYTSLYAAFNNCNRLQKFRIKTKIKNGNHPSTLNAPINLFTGSPIFNNCKSLVYSPTLGFEGGVRTNYGVFNNCDNLVVMHDDNTYYWNKENNRNFGIPSQPSNYINGSEWSGFNATNNIVIVGIGNGIFTYGDFCNNMPNLMMATAAEYITSSPNSTFSPTYGSYCNCNNLVYGRFLQLNNYAGYGYNYNNCSNMLLFETSETALHDMINIGRGFDDRSSAIQITYSYYNCFNLVEMRMPRLGNSFQNIYYSFDNCYNLRYAQIAVNYMYGAFNNCYNLRYIYHGITNNEKLVNGRFLIQSQLQSSFCNCYNLINSFANNYLISEIYYSFNNTYNIRGELNLGFVQHVLQSSFYGSGVGKVIISPTIDGRIIDSFGDCPNLYSVDITLENNIPIQGSFSNCQNLTDVRFEGLNSNNYVASYGLGSSYCSDAPNLKNVTFVNYVRILSGGSGTGIENINLIGNNIVIGYAAFSGYANLKNITGNIYMNNCNFAYSFSSCSSLQQPFNNIYVDVTNMDCMYANCANLLHSAHYNNVINMYHAYADCANIGDVYIGPTVTNFEYAYANCPNVASNISIESTEASWSPFIEWRAGYDLDIHISPESMLYTILLGGSCQYNNILLNAPEFDSETYADAYGHLDAPNLRFYWLQPNIHLNVYYDLITE